MAWTNTCSQDFYLRYIRRNAERFSDETVEDAERLARMRQARLSEFAIEA